MNVNRTYKDSLFRHLFNDKKRLLELYNAIEGTDYKNAQDIVINTLEDVFFIGMKNDISFIIDETLVLLEHQSTISGNIPLRMLMYLFRLYEKISNEDSEVKYEVDSKEVYNPKLIVLYNGKKDYPAESTLLFSTLFKNKDVEKKIVDAEVKVLNINKGINPELESKSKALAAYTTCIAKIREYEKEYTLEESIKKAIKYCVDNDLEREYFKRNSSEVMNMLMGEFNLDEYTEVLLKKGKKEGIEEGIKRGEKKGKKEVQDYILNLIEQGLSREEIKKKIEKMSKKNKRA